MPLARVDVEFTKEGRVFDPAQVDALLAACQDLSDLVVISHGWNNDMADARALYSAFIANFEKVRSVVMPGDGRRFAFCQVFWPSKKFTDTELIPAGGAVGAAEASDNGLIALLDELARDPERLPADAAAVTASRAQVPSVRKTLVDEAKALAAALDSATGRERFVSRLRALLDAAHADEEDGSDQLFTKDPEELFGELSGAVAAPLPAGSGGAAGSAGAGGAAGLSDLWTGAVAAARRLANFSTYYQMKSRAGDVGANGLAPVLKTIRSKRPDLRLHLVGHSFGGLVVTAAAHGLPRDTPAVTITLLQAAYSHNGLSENYGKGKSGFYRALLAERRASGPIVITHTKNDRAVGIAYPLASRIAQQKAVALGDRNDPYGGMGRNGAQHTREVKANPDRLGELDTSYAFEPGAVYNLLADAFIKDHGDVTGPQVAAAVLAVTRTV